MSEAPGPADFNSRVIREFRANGGEAGPPFDGAPLLLITSTGAKSGAQAKTSRTIPVIALERTA